MFFTFLLVFLSSSLTVSSAAREKLPSTDLNAFFAFFVTVVVVSYVSEDICRFIVVGFPRSLSRADYFSKAKKEQMTAKRS